VKTIKIGMLGCGVVGGSVARELASNSSDLAARAGAKLELTKIAVRSLGKRDGVADSLLTTDAESVVTDPDIQLVIEVMGGIEPARELILKAMANGKSVVTANKALLASHGADLYAAAEKAGVDLYYEAAVAGAIPIIRPLRESLVGDHINRVMGIVNGTTNFILTKMDEEGLAFDQVLKEAQALGYAEADPTADVEGHDAAAKAAILAGLAFHSKVTAKDVYCEGITKLTAQDVITAKAMNKVIKLIAIAERTDQGIAVRVHPMMLDRSHPLASVREAFNAVFVESEGAGQLMFYGRGAGGAPTASAVLGDVVAVARHLVAGSKGPAESDYADLGVAPQGAAITKYAIRLSVNDKPGVLANVANTFAGEGVSIQTVRQTGRGEAAELTVVTHRGTEAALQSTVKKLSNLDVVREVESVIRVEGSAS
jgi:homoserine dehydrogenase